MRRFLWASLPLLALLGALPAALGEDSPAGEDRPMAPTPQTASELRSEIIAWHKLLAGTEVESAAARQEAAQRLASLTDERAVPFLMALWKQEESPQRRKILVSGLESIGGRAAFKELVKVACEDSNPQNRAQAARWIAKQENREDAIPQFVKYLKGKKYFRHALTSLGYTEIAKKASHQDPELVAALIDNLVTVTPKRSWAYVYSSRIRRLSPSETWGHREINRIPIVEYETSQNEEVKALLYQYTLQDYEYDQKQWRRHVLRPLQKQSRFKQ